MKKILFLLLAGSCGLLWAQTNSPAPAPPEQEIGLHYGQFYYDGKAHQLVYYDNVVATNYQGTMTCGRLAIFLPPDGSGGSHPTNIVAETNVIIDFQKNGWTNHGTSDKAIYAYSVVNEVTNEKIYFTGHARFESVRNSLTNSQTGEPLIWDNIAGRLTGVNGEVQYNIPHSSENGTNAPSSDLLK